MQKRKSERKRKEGKRKDKRVRFPEMELEELFFPPLESPLSSLVLSASVAICAGAFSPFAGQTKLGPLPSVMSSDRFFVKNRTKSSWKISSEHLIQVGEETNTEKSDERNDRKLVGWRLFLVVFFLAAFQFVYLLHLFFFFFFLSSRLFITSFASLIPSLSGTCVTMENCHTRSPIFASVTLHHLISLKKVEVWTYRLPGVLLSRFYTAAVPYVYLHFSEF